MSTLTDHQPSDTESRDALQPGARRGRRLSRVQRSSTPGGPARDVGRSADSPGGLGSRASHRYADDDPAFPTTPNKRLLDARQKTLFRAARQLLPTARTIVVRDFAAQALIDEIERARSTLVVVGSHGQARTVGILTGSTATKLLHDAPCSVLLARPMRDVPRRIAVGVDGSPESAAAYAVARQLAERFDGDLTVVVAEGGKRLDVAGVSLIAGDGFHVIPDEPVPVLVAASADADLLVLGSRGLHGVKSLGSVSERVAHRAECSTLIVRAS